MPKITAGEKREKNTYVEFTEAEIRNLVIREALKYASYESEGQLKYLRIEFKGRKGDRNELIVSAEISMTEDIS